MSDAKKNKTQRERCRPQDSGSVKDDLLNQLREMLPGCFNGPKLDFDKMRDILGDDVDDRPERYSFTWAGKRDAIRHLERGASGSLVPCPAESVNFDTTNNIFIEGNLEVLKILYKSYSGRVKMIYIDPTYNTGHDFIYPDKFDEPLEEYFRLTGQKDAQGNLLTSNTDKSGRYHSA
jgi:adenine-specific DNA-methyltransferase